MTFRNRSLNWVRNALLIFLVVLFILNAVHGIVTRAQDVTNEPTQEFATDPAPEPTLVVTVEPTENPPPPVEEPPEETPVTEPQELLGLLFSLLKDATYIAWASAGVVVVVGLLKSVFQFSGSVAILVTLAVQVLVWAGYAFANYFGAGEAFKTNYLILVDIGRSLLPLAGSIFAGQVIYKASAKRDVPIMGYRAPQKSKFDAAPGVPYGSPERESRTDRQ